MGVECCLAEEGHTQPGSGGPGWGLGCWLSCTDSLLFLAGMAGGLGSMAPSSQVAEKPVSPEPGPGQKEQSWRWLVCFLCFYGFLAQMRPGESFITPYLLSPAKNFTRKQACGCSTGRSGLRARGGLGTHQSAEAAELGRHVT